VPVQKIHFVMTGITKLLVFFVVFDLFHDVN
jgi:hypothetical protein